MKKIAIFASGSGSNAENIIRYFSKSSLVRVDLVLSNTSKAYVLERASRLGVETMVFSRSTFYDTSDIPDLLIEKKIDFIVLAGFLWLLPENLIKKFPSKIVNIHPALLPKYGGKGFYGSKVHESVVAAGESESGITIHYVNDKYDSGDIIFQAKCTVLPSDTAEDVANKVHSLEYEHFPKVIESILMQEHH